MSRSLLPLALGLLAVLAAGGAHLDRVGARDQVRLEREAAQAQLETALRQAATRPSRFGVLAAAPAADGSLKPLAQELAASRQVPLGYLSESERDGEGGRRERQLVLRLVNAPHPNLVRFLEDLEARGAGARVKEVHLRPSREHPDAYEEAEVVLARPAEKAP
jgi:hypothetical protein